VKRKCDKCDRPATTHSVEIVKGTKIEKHLCDEHAMQEPGMAIKSAHTPIDELLSTFVKMQSGTVAEYDPRCDNCQTAWSQFRERSLLGCPQCYSAFEEILAPLFEHAHDGGSQHIGKVPRRAGAGEQRQQQLTHMRKRLDDAVKAEDYESAAHLRDEIERFEQQVPS